MLKEYTPMVSHMFSHYIKDVLTSDFLLRFPEAQGELWLKV